MLNILYNTHPTMRKHTHDRPVDNQNTALGFVSMEALYSVVYRGAAANGAVASTNAVNANILPRAKSNLCLFHT